MDSVKIDRTFVRHAQTVEVHRVLIEATIRVARTLGMTTVAEGIETEGQAALLAALACDRGQGWLYGRPMTAAPIPSPGRIARLPARRDFLRVQAAGRRQVTPGFILQTAPLPAEPARQGAPRVGFTASKKVGNAVARNRARRRLRALAREVLAPLAAPGFDFVLIGRQGTLERDYAAMVRDLKGALRRLLEKAA